MRFNTKGKKSVFKLFLVSYIFVLIIPLMLGSISYLKAVLVLEEEAVKYNVAMLEQTKQSIEGQLETLNQMVNEITLNPKIQKFLIKPEIMHEDDLYQMFLIVQDLTRYVSASSFLDKVYIYFKNSDTILSDSGKYSTDFFYNTIVPYKDMDVAAMKETISAQNYMNLLPPGTVYDGNKTYRFYSCVSSLNSAFSKDSNATLVAMINEDRIHNLISHIGTASEGSIYIINQDNQVIASTDSYPELGNEIIQRLVSSVDSFSTRIGDRDVVISCVESNYNKWKYISVISTDVFMYKVNYIKKLTIGIFAVSLIIGLIIAYFFALKNYKPLRDIAITIKEKMGVNIPGKSNEYDYMKLVFNDILNTNNRYMKVLNGRVDVVKYLYPTEVENKLFKSVKAGDVVETTKLLEKTISGNIENSNMTAEIIQCMFLDIICTAIKVASEIEYIYNKDFNPIGYILECKTVDEMKTFIFKIYTELCAYVNDTLKDNSSRKIINTICEFIVLHYADPNLSLSSISDSVNLTPSYVSRFFKEHAGESIVNYINRVRIGKAMELLKSGSILISDIAGRVGYTSDDALIKAFKKFEGITPGKYRRMIGGDE